MDNGVHHSDPVIRRIYLYLFIVTFLLFFVFVVLYFSKVQPSPSPEEQTTGQQVTKTRPLKVEKKGSMTLSLKNNDSNQVQLGQTFSLSVAASSENSSVVGFDVLLSYDQSSFTLGNATTPLQSFQLFSTKNSDHESFTAALSPTGKAVDLQETEILTVPFTAKQKGKYTFTILPKSGNEKTKLVEAETTKLFAPTVAPLQITVN